MSRGGRPNLAGPALPLVRFATLLIVGGNDTPVVPFNREAFDQLGVADKQLTIVSGPSHLFEEPGTLEEVAWLAGDWYGRYLHGAPKVRIAQTSISLSPVLGGERSGWES